MSLSRYRYRCLCISTGYQTNYHISLSASPLRLHYHVVCTPFSENFQWPVHWSIYFLLHVLKTLFNWSLGLCCFQPDLCLKSRYSSKLVKSMPLCTSNSVIMVTCIIWYTYSTCITHLVHDIFKWLYTSYITYLSTSCPLLVHKAETFNTSHPSSWLFVQGLFMSLHLLVLQPLGYMPPCGSWPAFSSPAFRLSSRVYWTQ